MTVAYPPFTSSTMAETVSFGAAPSASDIDRHIATIVHEGRQFDKRKDGRAALLALKAQAGGEICQDHEERCGLCLQYSSLSQTGKERVQKYRSTMQRTTHKRNRAQKRQLATARSGTDESAEARSEEKDEARLLLLRLSSSAHRWTFTLMLVVLARTWQSWS